MAKQQDAVIPERTRVLVMAVYELLEATPATGYVSEPEVKVSQRRLSELTGIPKSAVDRAVADAIDRGFLVNEERVPKRPMRLTKGDVQMSAEDDVSHVLPTPEEIANRMALN
jgi:formaldehyde-activating enzyme involved in methanogenesis